MTRTPALPRPQLVIFDVDGTLQDTCQWWPVVLRRGLAAFATPRGFTVELPDDASACAVIGKRDADVWSPFLPPEFQHLWPELRSFVVPMECDELRGRTDYLFPGVRRLLDRLRCWGVRSALASNCRRQYFTAVREGLGLGFLTDWQYCLDSPGVTCKADMLARAMEAAGTTAAVMVGDRDSDQEAARLHRLPFVWRRNPFCHLPDADGVWDGDPASLFRLLGLPATE